LAFCLGSAGCLSSLGLDEYSFDGLPDGGITGGAGGGSGRGGAGGSAGVGGGGGGTAGASNGGSAGAAGTGGSAGASSFDTPDAAVDAGGGSPGDLDAGDGSAPLECAPGDRCVPAVPVGWEGPLALSSDGVEPCPSEYPTLVGELNADLQVGEATCNCGCFVNSAECRLLSGISGEFFTPVGSCDSPPDDDDCLTAITDATCLSQPFSSISPSVWGTTEVRCEGAAPSGLCADGACYPSPSGSGFGALCIGREGEHDCPDGFPNGTTYFLDVADDRACSTCTCSPAGQECEIMIEVCSVGFFTVTLNEGDEQCLNSSDGDSVSLLSTNVTTAGTCTTAGGALQGSAQGVDPITVCCMD
jgi:hypothetical protein